MSESLEFYKEILQMQKVGKLRTGKHIKNFKDELNESIFEDFENNPAYRIVKWNDEKIGIHFIKKQRDFGSPEIYIISKPENKISVSDYVKDEFDNTWLCYSLDDYPLRKNFMGLCNRDLRWRDKDTGKIHSFPCMLTDKTSVYSDGLSKGRKLTLANDQIMCVVQKNEFTSKLPYGQRIIFANDKRNIYKVVRIDSLPKDNLVDIRLRHELYDPFTDDLESGLADDIAPKVEDTELDHSTANIIMKYEGYDEIIVNTAEYYKLQAYKVSIYGKETPINDDVELEVIKGNHLVEVKKEGANLFSITSLNGKLGDIEVKMKLATNSEVYSIAKMQIVNL